MHMTLGPVNSPVYRICAAVRRARHRRTCPLPLWERALRVFQPILMGEGDSPLTHSFH